MRCLTDNDTTFGPLTFGTSDGWSPIRAVISSPEEDEKWGDITVYAFGKVARLLIPPIIRPFKEKHIASSWDEETIKRMGCNWYYNVYPRTYGFSLHEGFFQVFYGAQTHDSLTTQNWGTHLPWTQWRFVRFSLYDENGNHYWTGREDGKEKTTWHDQYAAQERCPSVKFAFKDYDGEIIVATTRIEEREWKFGEGWFKWLKWFKPSKIVRQLDLEFDKGIGPEKSSWKGGTTGHSIEMLPGELHEEAFRRYCNIIHRGKYRPYELQFIGKLTSTLDNITNLKEYTHDIKQPSTGNS